MILLFRGPPSPGRKRATALFQGLLPMGVNATRYSGQKGRKESAWPILFYWLSVSASSRFLYCTCINPCLLLVLLVSCPVWGRKKGVWRQFLSHRIFSAVVQAFSHLVWPYSFNAKHQPSSLFPRVSQSFVIKISGVY